MGREHLRERNMRSPGVHLLNVTCLLESYKRDITKKVSSNCGPFFVGGATLGLRCCTWAFSSCEQELSLVEMLGLLNVVVSLVAQHGL